VAIFSVAKPFAPVTVLYVSNHVKSRGLLSGNNSPDGIGAVIIAGKSCVGDTTRNTSSLTAMLIRWGDF